MSFIASIDQGTSSTRCFIFDEKLHVLSWHQATHRQQREQQGWTEHDPEELYKNVCFCLIKALEKAKTKEPSFTQLKCIGITNQRETAVAWDKKTGKPLHNAIVWNDVRAQNLAQDYSNKYLGGDPKKIDPISGLLASPYFTAFKFQWMLENSTEVKEALKNGNLQFGTVDSWLIYKLSRGKVHSTDVVNASRTFLMNLEKREWSEELCQRFGVPMSCLPKIHTNSELYGYVEDNEHSVLNALEGKKIPITGCIGDQQSALLGNFCLKPGEGKATYGSGCFILVNVGETPKYSSHGLLSTVAFQIAGKPCTYAVEGAIGGAGLALEWMRTGLGIYKSLNELDSMCYSVNDTDGVIFVPAFNGLLAPYWQPQSRACILGLSYRTKKAHIVRALFHSLAQQVSDILGAYCEEFGASIGDLRVDGGVSQNRCLLEIQSDLLGVNVLRPHMLETTALGAAICAGLSAGVWPSLEAMEAVASQSVKYDRIKPNATSAKDKELRARLWKEAVAKSIYSKL